MIRTVGFLLGMMGAGGAVAQDADIPCGGDHSAWLAENADDMRGIWTDTPVKGLLQGRPMPVLGPPEPVNLLDIPNGFSTVGQEPRLRYDLLLTDAPFAVQPPGGPTELARIDTQDIPECAITDLPHLTADYRINMDGDWVEGTVVAVVASTTRMHVWFTFEAEFGRIEMLSTMTR